MNQQLKQQQIDKRNKQIVAAYQKAIKNNTLTSKEAFAKQFNISARTLNRVLDEFGLRNLKPQEKKPTASVSAKSKTKAKSSAKKKTTSKAAKKPSKPVVEEKAVEQPETVDTSTTEVKEANEPTPTATVHSWTVDAKRFISVLMSDGEPITVQSDHENYDAILNHLIANEVDKVPPLMSIKKKIEALNIRGFTVSQLGVQLNGKQVNNDIVDDIIDLFNREEPIEHLVNFLDNLMLTPTPSIYNTLWKLLKHAGMKITPEGYVEAFKRVNADFTDCYTNKIDNSVGTSVTMQRDQVDDNDSRTCSAGLHVCAFQYLKDSGYGARDGAKVVKVVVRPQDFVAIPPDYKFTKARTCHYKVVADVTEAANRGDFNAA